MAQTCLFSHNMSLSNSLHHGDNKDIANQLEERCLVQGFSAKVNDSTADAMTGQNKSLAPK
jgi:hypothetical protein